MTAKLHPGDSPLGTLVPWLPTPPEVKHDDVCSYPCFWRFEKEVKYPNGAVSQNLMMKRLRRKQG